MTTYHAILEVEAHANGGRHDTDRYLKSIADLRQASVNTHEIEDVITTSSDEPTRVKHFGYNYKCEAGCNHTMPAYGVNRYFGLALVIRGYVKPEASHFLFGTYRINEYAHIDICGCTKPHTGERRNLSRIGEKEV